MYATQLNNKKVQKPSDEKSSDEDYKITCPYIATDINLMTNNININKNSFDKTFQFGIDEGKFTKPVCDYKFGGLPRCFIKLVMEYYKKLMKQDISGKMLGSDGFLDQFIEEQSGNDTDICAFCLVKYTISSDLVKIIEEPCDIEFSVCEKLLKNIDLSKINMEQNQSEIINIVSLLVKYLNSCGLCDYSKMKQLKSRGELDTLISVLLLNLKCLLRNQVDVITNNKSLPYIPAKDAKLEKSRTRCAMSTQNNRNW